MAAFGYEFIERVDGFKGLSETYDLEFEEPPKVMELGLTYRALAEKNVDLIAGDATNGLIAALDLFMLEDDQGYFPPYDGVPIFRTATLVVILGCEKFSTSWGVPLTKTRCEQ